jgi:FlaA1/EpsC-like NDP-sugar epimerase
MKKFLFAVHSSFRRSFLVLFHVGLIALSLTAAFFLRHDFALPALKTVIGGVTRPSFFQQGLWIAVVVKTVVFLLARLHRGWWRFVGINDLLRVFFANVVASAAFTAAVLLTTGPPPEAPDAGSFPRSIYVIDFVLCFLMTAGARFAVRLYTEGIRGRASGTGSKGLLIYGAGGAGRMLLREIRSNHSLGYEVIGFLDDDPKLRGAHLMNIRVLGTGRDAAEIVDRHNKRKRSRKIEEIVIAMPSASGRQMGEAVSNCRAAGVSCKTIPGIGELLKGKVLSAQIRDVSLDDLLGREQVRLDEDRIHESIARRSVLITGAGGSIGSELCRQAARFHPEKLIALDQGETELFKIDLELREKYPSLNVIAEVGDIRDAERVEEVIRRHSVDSIFHAAAYKHVPMMEAHVIEAVKNNVVGTWNLVKAACEYQVSNFLMISSDKAVNPTSIMGVTKRIAELIVSAESDAAPQKTKFVSVRFGNVLGSNGSVVPLFKAQIAAGGPVTVTHPGVRRYFMSVREAVQLVLQASTMGKGSEIFVLDMGQMVPIVDLAKNLITFAGLDPEKIQIKFIGLRPGEKLYEELMTEGENILPTHHEKIKIFKGPQINRGLLEAWLLQLELLLEKRNPALVVSHLKELVPEYQDPRTLTSPLAEKKARQAPGPSLTPQMPLSP